MKIIFLLQLKPYWNPLKIVRQRQILLLTIQGKKKKSKKPPYRKGRIQFRKSFFFQAKGERGVDGELQRMGDEGNREGCLGGYDGEGDDRRQVEDGSAGGGGT